MIKFKIMILALSIICIILLVAIIIVSRKAYQLIIINEKLEEENNYFIDEISKIRDMAIETEIQLKEIDIRGSFEADDEVGFVFQDMKQLISELNIVIENIYKV